MFQTFMQVLMTFVAVAAATTTSTITVIITAITTITSVDKTSEVMCVNQHFDIKDKNSIKTLHFMSHFLKIDEGSNISACYNNFSVTA
jgi:hypothetical protein